MHTLCAKLSWSHLRILILIENKIERDFYIEIAKIENWSSRQLQERINSKLFERTAISKKPKQIILNDLKKLKEEKIMTSDIVFRDPYIFYF